MCELLKTVLLIFILGGFLNQIAREGEIVIDRKGFLFKCIFFCGVLSLFFWTTSAISQQTAEPPSAQIQSRGNIQNIQVVFTEEEQRWLAKGHTVRVRIGKAPPYSFFKEEPLGISGDYLNAVAQLAGFQVKYFPDIPWSDALKHLRNREKIDLLPALTRTLDRKDYITFTQNYLTSPRVIYTREDSGFVDSLEDMANKTISVERGYFLHQKLSDEYPDINLLIKETTEDALISLSMGEVDAYVGNLMAGTYVIKMKGLNNIKIAAPAPFGNLTLAMGVRKDWPELASIINKVLATFNQKEHVAICDKWVSPIRYEYGMPRWIKLTLTFVTGLLLIVFLLSMVFKHQVKLRTSELMVKASALEKEMSERKLVEEALKEHSERLEEMVEERTKDLQDAQEQLVRSEKLAALGKLTGILGHEIKTPIGVIKNSFEFLKIRFDQSVDEKIPKHLNIVLEKLNVIDKIFDDMFDFVRAKELKSIDIDSNKFVENVISSMPVPTNISIVRDFGNDLPHVDVDEIQIQQTFINIIANALDAMEEGGKLIISTDQEISDDMEQKFVTTSFKDTGAGIPKDDLKKIFEPLFTTKSKGTGLGLAACETYIHTHKGSIEVESEVGRGTVFTVKLPVKD
jgi:signal transduction histidine kinase